MSYNLINQYRRDLDKKIRHGGSRNELSIRVAFHNLLNGYCQAREFQLVDEITINSRFNKPIRPDGIVKDALRLDWGYWEAKDEKDNLDEEIEIKINQKGYPTDNILFQDNLTAVLIQNGEESLRINMEDDAELDKLLNQFLDYERAEVKDFRTAIASFSEDLPTILTTLRNLIDDQGKSNAKYIKARDKFLKICQDSINPEINIADLREMIIQHILTEDIFISIFDEAQFHQENNIACQLQEVMRTFFTRDVKRNTLKTIQSYYQVIIRTAGNIVNHHEKQKFLKVVYENFYKTYNPLAADRLGIVYTPNEIVKFMVESTDYLLNKHFQKSLGDKGVEILDPATGTGTFITEILEYLLTRDLEYKYKNEIHCNEVSILPYYIANLNIEYTYKQRMGEYLEFENICLVDTLDSTDIGEKQLDLFSMTQENTERIKRQNERKISVIIGNPPYNAKQENFNQNNANRKYENIDKRIKDSYIKEGTAQNQIVVYDMYTRFIRWATDRLNENGVIAFVSNSSFIDALAFDGFRKVIAQEFNEIWIINTKGNARNSGERRRQEGGNVFSDLIKVGIAVYFMIKNTKKPGFRVYYYGFDDYLKAEDKKAFFTQHKIENLDFLHLIPDKNYNWINQTDNDFDELLPLIDKDVKSGKSDEAIFKLFSRGLVTQRDEWVYDCSKKSLESKVKFLIEVYQQTLRDNNYQDKNQIKWDADLNSYLTRKIQKEFNHEQIVTSAYRPFCHQYLYFDKHFNGRTYQWFNIYNKEDLDNKFITFQSFGSNRSFNCLITNHIAELHLTGANQCLPLYRYENGTRIENITDWGLQQFREYYNNVDPPQPPLKKGGARKEKAPLNKGGTTKEKAPLIKEGTTKEKAPLIKEGTTKEKAPLNKEGTTKEKAPLNKAPLNKGGWGDQITKEDIFNYIYAVLHNPEYRQKYELNLKRDLPRIPFYDNFWQWGKWGKELMELHLNYETIKPYDFKRVDIPLKNPEAQPKVKLKADKIQGKIILDEITTLENIPPLVWEYKLGNRSALEWILDQYKEKKPKDKTIAEKFNTYKFADYKEQVIDLLQRVCTVSIETMQIIQAMEKTN